MNKRNRTAVSLEESTAMMERKLKHQRSIPMLGLGAVLEETDADEGPMSKGEA